MNWSLKCCLIEFARFRTILIHKGLKHAVMNKSFLCLSPAINVSQVHLAKELFLRQCQRSSMPHNKCFWKYINELSIICSKHVIAYVSVFPKRSHLKNLIKPSDEFILFHVLKIPWVVFILFSEPEFFPVDKIDK